MRKLISILFLLSFQITLAQDIHFSQFYSSPLTINPANTGLFNGTYRIGANYKNQWSSVPVPFNTFSGWADVAIKRPDKETFGKGGLGLYVVQDQAGDGKLSATKVNLSGAVHLPLDENLYNYISVGIAASYIQRRIDFTQLYWGNQWDGTAFNTQLSSKEPYKQSTFSYFDAAVGVDYLRVINERHKVHGGFSIQHLAMPKETFYEGDNRLGIKPTINLGGRFKLSERSELWTETFFERERKAQEWLLSGLYGYNTSNDYHYTRSLVWLGLSFRWGDALVPVMGYEYNHIRCLINYDINLSGLRAATQARGGFEVSIIYIGEKNTPQYRQPRIVPCPVF